jgi:hypothetical protein
MPYKPKWTAQQMIDALVETKGMVYLAAQRLGCAPHTVYNYRDRYAGVRAVIEAEDGKVTDTAELKLHTAILNGEPWAISFRLKTKGRNRGYVEKSELDVTSAGEPIRFVEVVRPQAPEPASE